MSVPRKLGIFSSKKNRKHQQINKRKIIIWDNYSAANIYIFCLTFPVKKKYVGCPLSTLNVCSTSNILLLILIFRFAVTSQI